MLPWELSWEENRLEEDSYRNEPNKRPRPTFYPLLKSLENVAHSMLCYLQRGERPTGHHLNTVLTPLVTSLGQKLVDKHLPYATQVTNNLLPLEISLSDCPDLPDKVRERKESNTSKRVLLEQRGRGQAERKPDCHGQWKKMGQIRRALQDDKQK